MQKYGDVRYLRSGFRVSPGALALLMRRLGSVGGMLGLGCDVLVNVCRGESECGHHVCAVQEFEATGHRRWLLCSGGKGPLT